MKNKLDMKSFFIGMFILLSVYFLVLKSELYESRTAVIVRDIGSSSPSANIGLSLLGAGPSTQLQDSKVVEEYLASLDLFLLTNEKFQLMEHYKSFQIDFIEKLSQNSTTEEALAFYRTRMITRYDEVSGILHISYNHTKPKKAQAILDYLVSRVEFELNEFNRRKAKKQLSFIEQEHTKNKDKLDNSSSILEEYQNKHLLLDPKSKASSSTMMIANLEATLTEKKIELSTKKAYLNSNNYEVIALKSEIREIKNSLLSKKKMLTGTGATRLNKVLFEYERLKMQLEFDTQIYTNTLIQLETTKLEVLKEAKTLSVVSKPNLPDGYSYPNKPKVFITIIIVMLLLYGISSMLLAIIKDHKE